MEEIKWGSFDSKEEFASYYKQHYKPILASVTENSILIADEIRLLHFLEQDLDELFEIKKEE